MKKYVLYFDPYVYAKIINNKLLLYNTLNHKTINICLNKIIKRIISNLLKESNLYSVILTQDEYNNIDLQDFLEKIRSNFMGDAYETTYNYFKPIQPIPVLIDHLPQKTDDFLDLPSHLSSINLFINNEISILEEKYPKKNQFKWYLQGKINKELDSGIIIDILESLQSTNVEINLIGDIFKHCAYEEIIEVVRSSNRKINFMIKSSALDGSKLNTLISNQGKIHLLIDDSNCLKAMNDDLLFTKNNLINYHFAVSSQDDFVLIKDWQSINGVRNLHIHPYYNGKNLEFFKKNVFSDENSIIHQNLSIQDIYSRKIINTNAYGTIYITNEGIVQTNLNSSIIGNLKINNIWDIIKTEIINKQSIWRNVRSKVFPCNKCLFTDLCPSISNYEYVLERFNLCNIKNEMKNE